MMGIDYILASIMKLCGILFFVALGAFLLFTIESLVVCKWQELKARWKYQKILKKELKTFEKTLIETLSKPDDSDEI